MFNLLQVGIIVPVSFNKFKINSFLLTRVSAPSIVQKKKKKQHIHSQNNYCRKERIHKMGLRHLLLDKEIVQRTIRGLSKPIPKANYRSKKKSKKKKIQGNIKSFKILL